MRRAAISLALFLIYSVLKQDFKVLLNGRPSVATMIEINCYRTREF